MSRVDIAKNYLVSVAERTFGINAYRKEVAAIERFNAVGSARYTVLDREDVEKSGIYLGIFQVLIPTVTRVMLNDKSSEMNSNLLTESKSCKRYTSGYCGGPRGNGPSNST